MRVKGSGSFFKRKVEVAVLKLLPIASRVVEDIFTAGDEVPVITDVNPFPLLKRS